MPYRSFGRLLESRNAAASTAYLYEFLESAQGVQHRVDSAQLYVCTGIRPLLSLKIRLNPFHMQSSFGI
jgi:hypothetical protein